MPTLPGLGDAKFNFKMPDTMPTGTPSFQDILGTLKTEPQSFTNEFSKFIQPLMGGADSQRTLIEQAGATDLAKLTSFMQKRGITGSSTEGHAAAGLINQNRINLESLNNQMAFKLAEMLSETLKFDITRNDQIVLLLAQAMGQELTSARDIQMFREQLSAGLADSAANRRQRETEAILSFVGSMASTGMKAKSAGAF